MPTCDPFPTASAIFDTCRRTNVSSGYGPGEVPWTSVGTGKGFTVNASGQRKGADQTRPDPFAHAGSNKYYLASVASRSPDIVTRGEESTRSLGVLTTVTLTSTYVTRSQPSP